MTGTYPFARLYPLVFFCGCHLNSKSGLVGGHAMIRGLLKQLLERHPFDTSQLHFEINIDKLSSGDLPELCRLFSWLARRVPDTISLFCLIDGVVLYERREYSDSSSFVLNHLLEMTRDTSIRSIVKLLFTSPVPTVQLRTHPAFQNGENILSMATLTHTRQVASERRFARELRVVMSSPPPSPLPSGLAHPF